MNKIWIFSWKLIHTKSKYPENCREFSKNYGFFTAQNQCGEVAKLYLEIQGFQDYFFDFILIFKVCKVIFYIFIKFKVFQGFQGWVATLLEHLKWPIEVR